MLDLKIIMNNLQVVKQKIQTRGNDAKIIEEIAVLGAKRSKIMTKIQEKRAKRNFYSSQIGINKKNEQKTTELMAEVNAVNDEIDRMKNEELQINDIIINKMSLIPNLPNDNVPIGKNEDNNVVIAEYANLGNGKINVKKSHDQIAIDLKMVDFTRSVKMSGTRFWSYTGLGAKLLRALIAFMIDEHLNRGYQEISPPLIVKAFASFGVGQLPKFQNDLFKIADEDSYLISTGEVPLTNFYRDEIVNLSAPIKMTAYTPCFRQEAGSGGKDTKGLIRGHQFHKVELVQLVNHQQAQAAFAQTVSDAENILQKLKLPYRKLQLCTGDLGFAASETIDLEVWIPSQKCYREISSISIFNEFQSRRLKIRYKDEKNQSNYAITINGSGLALDRTIAAILENYQNEDNSITVPEVLRPYLNNLQHIK